jgi:hypothetical protein
MNKKIEETIKCAHRSRRKRIYSPHQPTRRHNTLHKHYSSNTPYPPSMHTSPLAYSSAHPLACNTQKRDHTTPSSPRVPCKPPSSPNTQNLGNPRSRQSNVATLPRSQPKFPTRSQRHASYASRCKLCSYPLQVSLNCMINRLIVGWYLLCDVTKPLLRFLNKYAPSIFSRLCGAERGFVELISGCSGAWKITRCIVYVERRHIAFPSTIFMLRRHHHGHAG